METESLTEKAGSSSSGAGKGCALIAKTVPGLEQILASELTDLGASDVVAGKRAVSFTGDKEMMYRANFFLRTAIRILKPIKTFRAVTADDVYNGARGVEWEKHILPGQTFAVDAVAWSEEFSNSLFVAYRVKDAVVDYFRDRTGRRPNISVSNPDIRLNIHISGDEATLSLDSSGESLHRRGYRLESVEAPINEVLAAGIILLTGWRGETDLIDPMCGSGTFLIEAALIARNMAPGLFRKGYAFEKWSDFDADLLRRMFEDDSREREFAHHIYGYDIDPKAVNAATANVRAAGLTREITVDRRDFRDFTTPREKAVMVMNPPYGERISTPDLPGTYRMIGERLKHAFGGGDAWILSYRDECFRQIGLKPSVRIPLYNGSLACELHQYRMFGGKFKDFRREGGRIKPEAETEEKKDVKKEAARRRKESAWRRLKEERLSNEEADIRSFTFHSLETEKDRRKKETAEKRRNCKETERPRGKSSRKGDAGRKAEREKRKKIFAE